MAARLHIAAHWGHEVAVNAFLGGVRESGCTNALVHVKDTLGRWPLHWAVENCHIKIVETLLEKTMSAEDGADVEWVIELAVQRGHLVIIAEILAWVYPAIWTQFSSLFT
ncbi:hypothetical protein N7493_011656 [Penicillium malachiteum]|uniref:Ankyrin repeat protein n=1 Tax=Penicillium malachiteum TaxID=1324776 RepID=A0AAD6MQ82_9EURO|nr:hypothetical protein N7493_011656 [Penicillium malachiteum]